MGFYTILNTGQLAGDSLLSPGAPVNNCRWASVQLSLIPGPVESKFSLALELVNWTWDRCALLCSIGAPVFIFSKGLERASAQAF